jgi:hypothetical protein
MHSFLADLRWAVRSWRTGLWFVGFVFFLACVSSISFGHAASIVLGLVVELFYIGFSGTQRIWYLRRLRGETFEQREVWSLTRSYFGRFVRLGLLCSIPLMTATIIWLAVQRPTVSHGKATTIPTAVFVAVGVLMDIGLTFVVPALAFSTDSAVDALRRGVQMIKATWPSSAWYVIAPGLTLSFSSLVVSTHALGGLARPVLGIIGGMLAFLLRGAVVPFYLRLHPEVGTNGSALVRIASEPGLPHLGT